MQRMQKTHFYGGMNAALLNAINIVDMTRWQITFIPAASIELSYRISIILAAIWADGNGNTMLCMLHL